MLCYAIDRRQMLSHISRKMCTHALHKHTQKNTCTSNISAEKKNKHTHRKRYIKVKRESGFFLKLSQTDMFECGAMTPACLLIRN